MIHDPHGRGHGDVRRPRTGANASAATSAIVTSVENDS